MFKDCLSSRYIWIWGVIAVLLYMMPYFILGENAYITIHDFLDSNVSHQYSVIALHLLGNPQGVLPVLDGVPSLNYMPLIPLDVKSILYIILPTYWAIVFNTLCVKLVAFIGMYLLVFNYITQRDKLCSLIVAVVFSIIPFYVDYGWSSAGVPLFLYAVCNLEKGKKFISYILIALFGMNSSLVLSGIFICVLWCIWIGYKWYQQKDLPKNHIYGLLLLGVIYLFVNISIIYNFFFPSDIISHRVEFKHANSIVGDFKQFFSFITESQYHAGAFLSYIILLITAVPFLYNIKKEASVKYYIGLYVLISGLILIGILVKHIPLQIFTSFQFDRFYFLYPTLCFILLAKAFSLVGGKCRNGILIIIGMLSLGSVAVCDGELKSNVVNLIGKTHSQSLSYSQFYDKELFSAIRKDLGSKTPFDIKVVNLGIFPSVAEMNSFYTLDSYVFSYSLDYKHKFRKVIEKELDKNQSMKEYYDGWGSRCYVFSAELNEYYHKFTCGKNHNISVEKLDIDTNTLKELGCEYILSAVDIKNYEELNLDFINSYTTDKSYWNIRVYKLN